VIRFGQRVQAPYPGVAIPGALLAVAVDLDDRVIDVDEHQIIDRGQHRGRFGEPGQHPGGHRVELAHVTEGEGPQERTQGGRCVGVVEDRAHRPVPQQGHVINAVRASDHPRHQRHHLAPGVRTLVAGNTEMPISQRPQPAPLGQGNDRYQSRRRHEIRVIEHRASHRVGMRELHPRDALLAGVKTDLRQAQFSQPARAFRHSDALTTPTSSVDRGLVSSR